MIFSRIFKLKPHNLFYIIKTKYSTKNEIKNHQAYIRNIGILAHIDAGKTTTTERMLFYSGRTNTLGEVHHGNTVTDHMDQERKRGITISSAAVTFQWGDYRINLVDTPGHIDFTMEVEQVLNALDGAIVIMDGSAGVEAQTLTVWNQADRNKLPRIVFVNKMDRSDADFVASCKSLINKLDVTPLPLYLPYVDQGQLIGIIDVITLQKIVWDSSKYGQTYERLELSKDLLDQTKAHRMELVDKLTEYDDELAEHVICNGTMENIDNVSIHKAIRNATRKQLAVPVLCGSAYKNVGIQLLMDAVVKYLPRPDERNLQYDCFGQDFCGRVFKVIHDSQRGGALCLVRVFRGTLRRGTRLVTARVSGSETVTRLYEPLADDLVEITEVGAGDIAVIAGLKTFKTGDLLVSSNNSLNKAKKNFETMLNDGKKFENAETDFKFEVPIPDPVFFCSAEPPSLAKAAQLETAILELQREDPSLHVRIDEETGQTILGGMGELHLEVIGERIRTEYKVDVELGTMHIAYHEKPIKMTRYLYETNKVIGNSKQSVKIDMSLGPATEKCFGFRLDRDPDNAELLAAIHQKFKDAAKRGAESSLMRGPLLNSKVVETAIILHGLEIARGTTDTFVIAAASQCVQKLLNQGGCELLEPLMFVEITLPEEKLSSVMADLSNRRATIRNVVNRGQQKSLDAIVPLSEMLGYAKILRTMSSGQAFFTMQPHGYSPMNPRDQEIAIRKANGL
ncbi:ribosome-releasing factor 2, mitochondrial-like [Ctenocephalides felis]|uniref:ribosome-releasing factor 2, mitochondrial-like n=1 Tax=Ctenocephalides felis TaxID=7515 RepID=UPI000E6E3473|nr:ribosome-releasing factor 2, mitochondrial-like [Ctenocephalides felis]